MEATLYLLIVGIICLGFAKILDKLFDVDIDKYLERRKNNNGK